MIQKGRGRFGEKPHAYFGCCPQCELEMEHFPIGRENWFVCHECKVRDLAGSNLLSVPDAEPWEVDAAAERICEYRIVEPLLWDRLVINELILECGGLPPAPC